MQLSDLYIIDTHSHINTGMPHDTEVNEAYYADVDYLNEMRKAARINQTFISSFSAVSDSSTILEENEKVRRICEERDYLYQWVVVDPRIPETVTQAREILKTDKCVGIKLHPLLQKYSILDYKRELFGFASEFGAKVLIHPESNPTHVIPVANEYPDVTFIMAHLNGKNDEHIAAIAGAKHRNVYTDVATMCSMYNRAVENAVTKIGSDRILFGTDTYAAGFIRGRIEYAIIPEEDKINILYNNARRLFADKI